jgi:hypothetical protein
MSSFASWACAGVTAASALVSLGYAVATVVSSRGEARPPASYALSRSVALAGSSLVVLATRAHAALVVVALAMVIVQALDAVVGVTIRDRMKTFGPAVLALLNLGALTWLVA